MQYPTTLKFYPVIEYRHNAHLGYRFNFSRFRVVIIADNIQLIGNILNIDLDSMGSSFPVSRQIHFEVET